MDIDFTLLGNCCEIHCTLKEIAHIFNCSEDTIQNRVKEQWGMTFSAYYEQKSADGRAALRRAQMKSAISGNATMQIWLGKQMLGQKDKVEHTGADGAPLIPLSGTDYNRLKDDELHTMLALLKKAQGA